MALDLEATWQEHKKFIGVVVGFAAVFSTLSYARASFEGSCDRQIKANSSSQERLLQNVSALEGKEGLEKGRRDGLVRAQEATLTALAWETDEAFKLPAGEKNLSIFVSAAATAAADMIVRLADRERVKAPRSAPELGVEANDARDDPAKATELLARADVAKRVVLAALELGARRIGPVRAQETLYVEQPAGADDKKSYVRVLPLGFTFEGSTRFLARLLERFEERGRFLEVVRARAARSKEGRDESGALEIEITLAQVTVVTEVPHDAKGTGSTEPGPGDRLPKRRRER